MKTVSGALSCVALLIALTTTASASTTATNIIATQLEAEGDRLGTTRSHVAEAISLYDRAIELELPPAARIFKRGELRLTAGDLRGAIADLTWALTRPDADRETVLTARAHAFRLAGNRARSFADCNEALRLNADNPQANGERAELELLAGNIGSAWRYATRATEMDSRRMTYESTRCRAAQQMKWPEGVAASCVRAQQLDADDR